MVLVTGASGFVGKALCSKLVNAYQLRILVRNKLIDRDLKNIEVVEGTLFSNQNLVNALLNVSFVIHCAARVHVMSEKTSDPLSEFRRVNVDGTLNLARQAAIAGVKRFIFLSSAKVNGEFTCIGEPFTADHVAAPVDPYGISKYEAEVGLRKIAKETGMEVVIIRSPLIYGPGVKANFLSMMRWIMKGYLLPLGGVSKNRRSFVYIDNLIDLIATCISHPAAANQIFLVSDDDDLSTFRLIRSIALELNQPARLIKVPTFLIILVANLLGQGHIAQRLCGSLQLDIRKTKDMLGWSPPVSFAEGLRRTVADFLSLDKN